MDQLYSKPKSTGILKFILPIKLIIYMNVQIITDQEMESISYIPGMVITL